MSYFIECYSFAKAYEELSSKILHNFEHESSPRNYKINEILNFIIQIKNPYSNLFFNENRSPSLKYLKDELKLYFSGSNNLEEFGKASKFWLKLSNDDKTINSAYGYLLFVKRNIHGTSQWEWSKSSLLKDQDTRQAILHFNDSSHQYEGNLDFPCTLNGNFHIRDNKLHFTIMMRSNDLVFGVSYDIPFFMLLMQCMRLELLEKYPQLELGTYTHIVNSMHLYEKDFEKTEESLNHDFKEVFIPQITVNPILNLENPKFKITEFASWLNS